ncbi:MAG: SDR family oxidoreductase [Melioribacteraceae bacterium]|nr:SDR family oxidoreductase [Melioribacteraceae bacterium]MCF8266104.1 SDR family oxidoreductase [Melioribacteraceae bacterium]MCF8430830.1 SDR family oxidoreductase [Melioribacteraceae bacterium]
MKRKVLITGSTDGIGKATARILAENDFYIIIHGRNEDKCKNFQKELLNKGYDCEYVIGDFASLKSVSEMANCLKVKHLSLDILINNAGIYMKEKEFSVDGFEMTFAVNHLAPFLLTNLLLDTIKNSNNARIINVSSIAHTRGRKDFDNLNSEQIFDHYAAYAQSKLANVFHTYELAQKLNPEHVTVNCLHPGVISTKLLKKGFGMEGASLEEGASTSVYLASSKEVENISGKYFVQSKETPSSPDSYDKSVGKLLWEISEQMVSNFASI